MVKKAVTANTSTLLFDHDGTLINSEAVHYKLWCEILLPYGVSLSESLYCDMMAGVPVKQNAIDLKNHFDISASTLALENEKHEKVEAFLKEQPFPLMPYAAETIKACHEKGYTLAIVTGGSKLSVEKTLDGYGLREYISTVVAVEDVTRSKPDPVSYQLAMEKLGVAASACVAIEDTMHGLQSAVAAKLDCVVIPTAQTANHDLGLATVSYGSLQHWLEAEVL